MEICFRIKENIPLVKEPKFWKNRSLQRDGICLRARRSTRAALQAEPSDINSSQSMY